MRIQTKNGATLPVTKLDIKSDRKTETDRHLSRKAEVDRQTDRDILTETDNKTETDTKAEIINRDPKKFWDEVGSGLT